MTDAKKGETTIKPAEKPVVQYTQDRYLTRILKGMALPLLYTVVSILMLRNYSAEYPNYFEYEILFIAAGAVLGLMAITGSTVYNVMRAKKDVKRGAKLETKMILIAYLPIMVIVLVIALFFGLSQAWQLSVGFFATTAVPPLFVLLIELASKGHLMVREYEKPSKMRYLVLIPNA
jgi:hypothetical protein